MMLVMLGVCCCGLASDRMKIPSYSIEVFSRDLLETVGGFFLFALFYGSLGRLSARAEHDAGSPKRGARVVRRLLGTLPQNKFQWSLAALYYLLLPWGFFVMGLAVLDLFDPTNSWVRIVAALILVSTILIALRALTQPTGKLRTISAAIAIAGLAFLLNEGSYDAPNDEYHFSLPWDEKHFDAVHFDGTRSDFFDRARRKLPAIGAVEVFEEKSVVRVSTEGAIAWVKLGNAKPEHFLAINIRANRGCDAPGLGKKITDLLAPGAH